ncbi:unnamed protein product [Gordionus sp. m RMFG-2023]
MAYKAKRTHNTIEPRYFLLIEGAKIDKAHHEGKARLALEETIDLDKVLEKIIERESRKTVDDTLIIVTSDHSHVFTHGGYPLRGLNRAYANKKYELSDIDNMPYASLNYGNGPGGINTKFTHRQNLTNLELGGIDYLHQAAVPLTEESHGGEDVPIYAMGPNNTRATLYRAHYFLYFMRRSLQKCTPLLVLNIFYHIINCIF